MRARAWALLLATVLVATGCGRYRTGYISMPYVGEVAPSREAGGGPKGWDHLRYLSVRGVDLYVNLMNDIETAEPWTRLNAGRVTPGRHCILLYVRPAIAGVSVEPRLLSLSVNGVSRAAETADRFLGTGSRSEEVTTEARIPLAKDQWNRFRFCFAGDSVNPDQSITLDPSEALRHPDHLPFPLIKFKMHPFRHLYS